jgi:hypothetical protein
MLRLGLSRCQRQVNQGCAVFINHYESTYRRKLQEVVWRHFCLIVSAYGKLFTSSAEVVMKRVQPDVVRKRYLNLKTFIHEQHTKASAASTKKRRKARISRMLGSMWQIYKLCSLLRRKSRAILHQARCSITDAPSTYGSFKAGALFLWTN